MGLITLFIQWKGLTVMLLISHLADVHTLCVSEHLRKFMGIHGYSWDRTKQNRTLFIFLGIVELRRQESFRILNPLPGDWEVTEPITLELSCHCPQIMATTV